MDQGTKRKAEADETEKRARTKKQWRVPRKNDHSTISRAIQPGDSGIWATCTKGRERKCVGQLRDLFSEYAELLYGDALEAVAPDEDENDGGSDGIEGDIQAEIAGIKKPVTAQLFVPVKLDVQCVLFFKTSVPVDPVSFVQRICEDAVNNQQCRRTRSVKRLSPMTLIGRASVEDLKKVTTAVLAPHFHTEPLQPKKFAIRPTLRNHNTLTRDAIIKQVAAIVGPGHRVDLRGYDLLIIVEVYQNVCGVSVVDNNFERLKRFNLAEISDPTPTTKDVMKDVQKTFAVADGDDARQHPSEPTPTKLPPASSMDLT